jgi:lysophospholipase L1-like esterase
VLSAMTQQLDIKPGKKSMFSGKTSRKASPEAATKVSPEKPAESTARKRLPLWASLLIASNGIVLLGVSLFTTRPDLADRLLNDPRVAPIVAKVWPNRAPVVEPSPVASLEPATETARTVLSYEQWLDVLKQEAIAVSTKNPEQLTVLLGDSLSLWFPPEQLPGDRSWLNQGISGETTAAMLKRLSFLDETKPQTILVMAGINDLKSGVSEADLLANYRTIVQTLKQKHPETELVIQSILPHSGAAMTVEEADRLKAISNEQIFRINQKLATIAKEEQALFLNLHPLFADQEGMLRSDLTTDGLHLSPAGYLVWSTALQTFSQTQLRSTPPIAQAEAADAPTDAPRADEKNTSETVKPSEETKTEN